MRTLIFLSLALTVAIPMIVLTGCGQKQPDRALLAAVDYSGSVNSEERADYVGKLEELIDRQDGKAEVTLYVFAKMPEKVYSGRPLDFTDCWLVDDETKAREADKTRGTSLAPTLEQYCRDAAATNLPVIAVLFTDGDCFDAPRTKAAAKKLADMPNFKGLMVGPLTTNRLGLENDTLSPLRDSGKLVTCGQHDVADGFSSIMAKVGGSR